MTRNLKSIFPVRKGHLVQPHALNGAISHENGLAHPVPPINYISVRMLYYGITKVCVVYSVYLLGFSFQYVVIFSPTTFN